MSVTFRVEPNELSFIAFDHRLVCTAVVPTDRRIFTTYAEAAAGISDHSRFCTDPFCGPDTAFVVARTAADDEPTVEASSVNGRLLLRALGLVPEVGAEAVNTATAHPHPNPGGGDVGDPAVVELVHGRGLPARRDVDLRQAFEQ